MPRPPAIRRRKLLTAVSSLAVSAPALSASTRLLNVSYDVSREFYTDYNAAFAAHWKTTTGEDVKLNQGHGGSRKQARSVVDGLEANITTMNQANDVDILHERGKLVLQAYLQHLCSDAGQEVAARRHSRPRSDKVLAKYAKDFPKVKAFTVDTVFAGWAKAQKDHYNDGASYDQVIATAKR